MWRLNSFLFNFLYHAICLCVLWFFVVVCVLLLVGISFCFRVGKTSKDSVCLHISGYIYYFFFFDTETIELAGLKERSRGFGIKKENSKSIIYICVVYTYMYKDIYIF